MIYIKVYKKKATLFNKQSGKLPLGAIYKGEVDLIIDRHTQNENQVYLANGKGNPVDKNKLEQFFVKIDDKFEPVAPEDLNKYNELNDAFEKVNSVSDLETPEYINYYGFLGKVESGPTRYVLHQHSFPNLEKFFKNEKYDPNVDIFQNLKNKMAVFDGSNTAWGYNKAIDDIKTLLESVKV